MRGEGARGDGAMGRGARAFLGAWPAVAWALAQRMCMRTTEAKPVPLHPPRPP